MINRRHIGHPDTPVVGVSGVYDAYIKIAFYFIFFRSSLMTFRGI